MSEGAAPEKKTGLLDDLMDHSTLYHTRTLRILKLTRPMALEPLLIIIIKRPMEMQELTSRTSQVAGINMVKRDPSMPDPKN